MPSTIGKRTDWLFWIRSSDCAQIIGDATSDYQSEAQFVGKQMVGCTMLSLNSTMFADVCWSSLKIGMLNRSAFFERIARSCFRRFEHFSMEKVRSNLSPNTSKSACPVSSPLNPIVSINVSINVSILFWYQTKVPLIRRDFRFCFRIGNCQLLTG